MRIVVGILMLLAAGAGRPCLAQPVDVDPLFEEQAEVQLREVWIRMRPVRLAPPGACDDFGLEDLSVKLDGESLDPTLLQGLEREPRPAVHALLVDASASSASKLDHFREAAADYVSRLDPLLDRALLMTFDESVLLQHRVSRDMQSLSEAGRRIRRGGDTALNDGLLFAMNELETHHERPVLLLLTDGFDNASLYSRDDVHATIAQRPDLTIFVVGVGMPSIRGGGAPGELSTRRFLQKIARDSNGHYFEIGTGGRVPGIFDRIRSMLGREALLSFTDPSPGSVPRRVRVGSRDPDCRVRTFSSRPRPAEDRHRPIASRGAAADRATGSRRALRPGESRRALYSSRSKSGMDPECGPVLDRDASSSDEDALRFLESTVEGARGCVLDITMEDGLLYSYDSDVFRMRNGWLKQKTRPLSLELPPPESLPASPVDWLRTIADEGMAAAGRHVETDPRQIPVEQHARPYHDVPMLINGKLFFELRAALARIAYEQPDYREWVTARLERRAEEQLMQHAARLSDRAPGLSPRRLYAIARESLDGQAILARAASPSEVDLQEFLVAWLGDISARDLFAEWERREVNRLVSGGVADSDGFTDAWQAARSFFFTPSYARVLTLLAPVHDRQSRRIGYYRVVLPRLPWMFSRVQDWKNRVDSSDLPLDLLPEVPLASWLASQPEIRHELRRVGGEVTAVRYAQTGKPRTKVPFRAFEQVRVTFELAGEDGPREIGRDVGIENGVPRLR